MAIETQSPECTWKWGSHVEIGYFLRLLISISYKNLFISFIFVDYLSLIITK